MKLEYTQHSVAWPSLKLEPEWHTDEMLVSAVDESGEVKWTFMTFSGGARGVQFTAFGDGLNVLYDPRMGEVMGIWSMLPDPDEITPAELIELLESVGATASEFHRRDVQ